MASTRIHDVEVMNSRVALNRLTPHQRLMSLFVISLVLLCLMIEFVTLHPPVTRSDSQRSVVVQLVQDRVVREEVSISEALMAPEPEPVEAVSQPDTTTEDVVPEPTLSTAAVQTPEPQRPSIPIEQERPEPDQSVELAMPEVTSAQILGALDKYSLEEPDLAFLHAREPFETTVPISRMISLTAEDVLSSNLPRLPLADGELNIRFYPSGFTGAVQRNWDRITPEFGFTTAQGIKVRCKFLLAIVACGWE